MPIGGPRQGLDVVVARGVALAFGFVLLCGAQDVVHFERNFPGASPERLEVRLTREGAAFYAEDGEEPVELSIGSTEAASVFDLVAGLDLSTDSLASHRRVASTGRKTLRYVSGGVARGEAVFDYSESKDAREVAAWFSKLAATYGHLRELERVLQFDRLGVNGALVSLEASFERNRIVAPELLAPILRKIVDQPRIVHLARARAEGMLERMRSRQR